MTGTKGSTTRLDILREATALTGFDWVSRQAKLRQIAKALGLTPPTDEGMLTVMGSTATGWWLTGCAEGDILLPDAKGRATNCEAIEAATQALRVFDHETWRGDGWYVLMIARVLDITPQQVLSQTWEEIESQLDHDKFYEIARSMRHQGSVEYYTREHLDDLRNRGKL